VTDLLPVKFQDCTLSSLFCRQKSKGPVFMPVHLIYYNNSISLYCERSVNYSRTFILYPQQYLVCRPTSGDFHALCLGQNKCQTPLHEHAANTLATWQHVVQHHQRTRRQQVVDVVQHVKLLYNILLTCGVSYWLKMGEEENEQLLILGCSCVIWSTALVNCCKRGVIPSGCVAHATDMERITA